MLNMLLPGTLHLGVYTPTEQVLGRIHHGHQTGTVQHTRIIAVTHHESDDMVCQG